jgi:hypothetical protein
MRIAFKPAMVSEWTQWRGPGFAGPRPHDQYAAPAKPGARPYVHSLKLLGTMGR